MPESDRGQNPQSASHPRMNAGHPTSGQGSGTGVAETARGLASQAAETAGQVKERVQEAASGAAGRIGDAWESTRQGIREGGEWVTDTASDALQNLQTVIRRNPVASCAIAFGLGFLVMAALGAAAAFRTDDIARRMSRYSS
jgi:hypothetical protein